LWPRASSRAEGVLELPITLPVLLVSVVHGTPIMTLNYDAGETIGWPAFVAEIAAAYRSLPPQRPDQPQDGPGAARGQSVV
jgi:hypothetical protein